MVYVYRGGGRLEAEDWADYMAANERARVAYDRWSETVDARYGIALRFRTGSTAVSLGDADRSGDLRTARPS
jgi:hypothetical protein